MALPAISSLSTQLRLAHPYRPEGMWVFFSQHLSLLHHFREEVIDCNSVDLRNEILMVRSQTYRTFDASGFTKDAQPEQDFYGSTVDCF